MKFVGIVGFLVGEEETCPGIYSPEYIERKYVGDVLRNNRRNQPTDKQSVDLSMTNQLSILSDLYMQQNWTTIRYVVWNGVKWQVSNAEIGYPRVIFDLGGVYNENEN